MKYHPITQRQPHPELSASNRRLLFPNHARGAIPEFDSRAFDRFTSQEVGAKINRPIPVV